MALSFHSDGNASNLPTAQSPGGYDFARNVLPNGSSQGCTARYCQSGQSNAWGLALAPCRREKEGSCLVRPIAHRRLCPARHSSRRTDVWDSSIAPATPTRRSIQGLLCLGARAMSAAIVAIGKMLFYQASATLPTTGQQEPRQNPDSLAAITQAKPLSGRTASVLFPEQYGEPAESHSLEIRLSSNSFKPVADDRFRAVRRTFRSHALIVPLSWVSEL